MPKILFTASVTETIYTFRRELITRVINSGYQAVVACAYSDWQVKAFTDLGCEYVELKISRQGTNPFSDIGTFFQYLQILRRQKPDVVLTYTVKPNIYASLACGLLKIPYINNITGLGVIGNRGPLQRLLFLMQRVAFRGSARVFFQNEDDFALYRERKIVRGQGKLIPGSGVNLEKFAVAEYPPVEETVKFLSIARLRKDKGIDELFRAVRAIDGGAEFHIIGPSEDDRYIEEIEELRREYPFIYHGSLTQEEVREFIAGCHCLLHPSHSEGMANVILESAATARPVIASDIPGCREAVDDGVSGYLFPKGDADALVERIERFMSLPWEQKREMGLAGRRKVEREFDRNIVIDAYMEEIERHLENPP